MDIASKILNGNTALGIEFGSTRIKAVLVDDNNEPIASGSHQWENRLENGLWTYSTDDIWNGIKECYQDLVCDVKKQYDVELTQIGAIGISAMMHGYMSFDKSGELLVPFRTWRNTNTGKAAGILTEEFNYNIPLRWSIAHLYQAVLDKEVHVANIDYITTLAGYVHWKLTGRKVLGIGDASGMFPIDTECGQYNGKMVDKFNRLISNCGLPWKIMDVLPEILQAGANAGNLTEEGAKLLDVTGKLKPGVSVCPPEGDAGTGMVATNSVAKKTGNVSAGTSVFAMVVMENETNAIHSEIDLVTTPAGDLVGMVHCNNCTSDINAWVNIFREYSEMMGYEVDMNMLYTRLFEAALDGDSDCGGLMGFNYFSGEPIAGLMEGRPMIIRKPDARFSLANFMRMQLLTSLGALKMGLDILIKDENIQIDKMYGHGGFFSTPVVGQKIMSAAMAVPVTTMETAGEGGAWGIGILANYMKQKADGESLAEYLENKVFAGKNMVTVQAEKKDVDGFARFLENYKACLAIEKAAVECW